MACARHEGIQRVDLFPGQPQPQLGAPPDHIGGGAGEGLNAQVRRAMADIPLGETRTYGEIARAVGAPAQAVGQACGANPLPILIPCHRVTGTDWFGGFSAPGGVETKAALLRHEGALLL